jgi:catechol 2,3-dioxygenase-like lactoylglutathione lyase family enzyme
MNLTIASLDHLVLTVSDISETLAFYKNILGMRAQSFEPEDGTIRWALCFGRQKINLHQLGQEFTPKAGQVQPGSGDLCFLVNQPIMEWHAHLREQGVEIIDGPVRRTGATGPILSLYFRDPDGNLIEVSESV